MKIEFLGLKSISILIALLFLFQPTYAQTPPPGWRCPTQADIKKGWIDIQKNIPEPYHARADFNGDGVSDDVWILFEKGEKQWGLFVHLSRKGKSHQWVELEKVAWKKLSPQRMGVTTADPGEYETACGKGYFDCKPGEPEVLKLTLPAIYYFMWESSDMFFYWDKAEGKFKKIWISD